jgi:hypothetical protein
MGDIARGVLTRASFPGRCRVSLPLPENMPSTSAKIGNPNQVRKANRGAAKACIDKRELRNEATRPSQQDRSAARETQPFIFQSAIARLRSVPPCNKHNPNVLSQIMLVPANNLPQTPPDTIASYCASEATRGNKANARQTGIIDTRRAKH